MSLYPRNRREYELLLQQARRQAMNSDQPGGYMAPFGRDDLCRCGHEQESKQLPCGMCGKSKVARRP